MGVAQVNVCVDTVAHIIYTSGGIFICKQLALRLVLGACRCLLETQASQWLVVRLNQQKIGVHRNNTLPLHGICARPRPRFLHSCTCTVHALHPSRSMRCAPNLLAHVHTCKYRCTQSSQNPLRSKTVNYTPKKNTKKIKKRQQKVHCGTPTRHYCRPPAFFFFSHHIPASKRAVASERVDAANILCVCKLGIHLLFICTAANTPPKTLWYVLVIARARKCKHSTLRRFLAITITTLETRVQLQQPDTQSRRSFPCTV